MADSSPNSPAASAEPGSEAHRPSHLENLRPSHLKEVLTQYGEALKARRKGIDRLNVYPVPDGDTGTNMSLTVQSVTKELRDAVVDDMHSISSAISKGAVMGARGNSGAILAQVLRGVAETAKDKASLEPADVAEALERARKGAYESVLKPVEGTILTVVSAASVAARRSADEGHRLHEQLDRVHEAAAAALARTPDLLPVLKQAGVVDAGGTGFLLFIDALRYVATGEPIPGTVDEADDSSEAGLSRELTDGSVISHSGLSPALGGHSGPRYEIMFLLEADDEGIQRFREQWGQIGDSIVVVGGDRLWNCHIHSDGIGDSIETALDYGRPRQIRVTDLLEQVGTEHGDAISPPDPAQTEIETAVVAVVSGDGMKRIYRSAGVRNLVSGGQSMNPSVAELLQAVEAAPSRNVIVLPNNKNIHAAANQVDALTDKTVVPILTTGVTEGMSAIVVYNPDADLQTNTNEMSEAVQRVTCGEITQAIRDAEGPNGSISKGDWLGLDQDGIGVVSKTLSEALEQLCNRLIEDHHEVLTVVEGDGAIREETEKMRSWLQENHPQLEVDLQEGGQPLYPYLLAVE